MAKIKKVLYTAKQIERWREALRRQHARELTDVKDEWFLRGQIDGRNALRQSLSSLLVDEAEDVEMILASRRARAPKR